MDYFHSPVLRAINNIFAFCEQTSRSQKNFLTFFEVGCTAAQLEFKPITSQDLVVLFLFLQCELKFSTF